MAKTGAHFTPCNVGSVEKHNERDPEYLKSVEASGRNIYFFQDQTRNNSSWVNPDYHGMSCKEIFERLKQLYIEKVGQAPQLNDRERVNKKTGRVYKVITSCTPSVQSRNTSPGDNCSSPGLYTIFSISPSARL